MSPGSHWLAVLRRGHCLREMLTGWLLASLLLMPVVGGGQEPVPTWWAQRGVIRPGAGLDDYAVINQGQLKNLVAAAVAEMNARLSGGAGPALNGTLSAWNASPQGADDFAAVNIGQLKATALPVYQRLLAAGAIPALPAWADAQAAGADDFALANVGQAKALFAFSVPFQDDPNIYRESLDALPVEAPFVIRYHDWRSGQVRPGRGEEGAAPEITTVHTGELRTYQWVAGETLADKPTKQPVGATVIVDFDQLAVAESWKNAHDEPAQPYLKHTTVVEVHYADPDPDAPGDSDWIYVYRDSVETNEEEGGSGTPVRTHVLTLQVGPGQAASNGWLARDGEVEYEMISEELWTDAKFTSAQVEAHWFSQVAAGPVTQPVAGWEAAPEQAIFHVQARLSDPGEMIPHEELNLPTAGGLVAKAHSALSSVQQTYEDAGGQTVTAARYTGERSQGYVTIAWRPDLAPSLSLEEKQAWLNRYRVTQKTTTTGQGSPEVETRPLNHYLEAGDTGSAYIRLSPDLQNGTQQEIEFHVSFLGLPLPPPVIMEALYAQQDVGLEKTALRGLVVRMKQGVYPVRNQAVTFELFESPGGLLPPGDTAAEPQTTLQRVTDDSGKARVEFKAADQPAYSWIKASAAGVQPQWFLMTVAGGGAGQGGEGFPANPPGISGVNFAYDANGNGISDAQENTPLDSDEDGVPDDEDMVPYDPLFRESRYTHSGDQTKPARGAGRYAVVDMGEGLWNEQNVMSSSGAIVWKAGPLYNPWCAWSPTNGETQTFTEADIEAATGLISINFHDINHEGHLCGLGYDGLFKPRVFRYDPFTGTGSVFPLSPIFEPPNLVESYGLPTWGPGDSIITECLYINEEGRQRRRLAALYNAAEAILEDVRTVENPAGDTPYGSPPATLYWGNRTERDVFTKASGYGGMIRASSVRVSEIYVEYGTDHTTSRSEDVSWSQEYRLHPIQGAEIALSARDLLSQPVLTFKDITTHEPLPWFSGHGEQANFVETASNADHLWKTVAGAYAHRLLYASAEQYHQGQALNKIDYLNNRGEALVSGTMADGTSGKGLWANGEATPLKEMLGEEVFEKYASSWHFHGLSDQGTFAASAQRLSDNSQRMLLLVPVDFGIHEEAVIVPADIAVVDLPTWFESPLEEIVAAKVQWSIIEGAGGSLSPVTDDFTQDEPDLDTRLHTSHQAGDTYQVKAELSSLTFGEDPEEPDEGEELPTSLVAKTGEIVVGPGVVGEIACSVTAATGGGSGASMPADGVSTRQITATLKDAHGNPVAQGTQVFWRLRGDGLFTIEDSETDAAGTARATLRAGRVPGLEQTVIVEADFTRAEYPVGNTSLEVNLAAGPVQTTPETGSAIKTFAVTVSANAADGTPVRWRSTQGVLLSAASALSGGTATATVQVDTRNADITDTGAGPVVVLASVAESVAITSVNLSPMILASAHQTLAPGDSTSLTIHAPSLAGQWVTVGGSVLAHSEAIFDAATIATANGDLGLTPQPSDRGFEVAVTWMKPSEVQTPQFTGGVLLDNGVYNIAVDSQGYPTATYGTGPGAVSVSLAEAGAVPPTGEEMEIRLRVVNGSSMTLTAGGATAAAALPAVTYSFGNPTVPAVMRPHVTEVAFSRYDFGGGAQYPTFTGLDANGQVLLSATGEASLTVGLPTATTHQLLHLSVSDAATSSVSGNLHLPVS